MLNRHCFLAPRRMISVLLIWGLHSVILAQTNPEILASISSHDSYNAYVNFAVNNTHFLANDPQGHVYVIFVDQSRNIIVMTRDNGNWKTQVVTRAPAGSNYRNPAIVWSQGKLRAAWLGLTSGKSDILYAEGIPTSETGIFNWSIKNFATFPAAGSKYLTLATPDSAYSPLAGFTESGDAQARLYHAGSEATISPMHSNLGTWKRSSDITIATDSNFLVVAWEEDWSGSRPKGHLVFAVSRDGGKNWQPTQNLLASGPTLGGDPCLAIANGIAYVAFHKVVIGNSSNIMVARMLPGMSQFEPLDLGTDEIGKAGKGWLPNIGVDKTNPDRLAVSWERTDGAYFDKWEHRVGVAYILHADENPKLILGPETASPPADTSLYDLNSNIVISPDGETVSFVWVTVKEIDAANVILTLYYQESSISATTGGIGNEPVKTVPHEIHLAQNYPNPFNPGTVIRFQLPVSGYVTLKVFDVTGREVATLVEGELAVGSHAVTFAPHDLACGIYFYQLTSGQFSQTHKAVLVK